MQFGDTLSLKVKLIMTSQKLDELAQIIDRACDLGNEQELRIIIAINQEYVERLDDTKAKATLYYFLANAWAGLHDIRYKKDQSSIWEYEQETINNQIINLRKAKKEKGFSEIPIEYQCAILTNLANIFNHTGRTVYSLNLYNQALLIEPNFVMARANRGLCLVSFADLDYDENHRAIFAKLAYDDLKKASKQLILYIKNGYDSEYYTNVKEECVNKIKAIELHLGRTFLTSPLEFNNFSLGKPKKEKEYRQWALAHTLFLNPMNDIGTNNIASYDPLNLPSLIMDIHSGFPKYITYFNQIKQEYVSYRHLLYEGIKEKTDKFYNKDISLIDDYDYNLYAIHNEKIKLAFRGFYSIFDKIAYFLNEYFDLRYSERDIDFRKIWKNKNNQKELNIKFNGLENLALRGLYFINKDLFFPDKDDKSFIGVVEPEAVEINEIRNHLEHKFMTIKILDIAKYQISNDRENIKCLTQEDLEEKTLHLVRLVREAIIYLSFALHIEEKKKDDKNIMPIQLQKI